MIDPEGEHLKPTSRTTFEITAQIFFAPVLRHVGKSYIIGTNPLARALTALALGDGEPLPDGEGLLDGGRTLRNIALRRLAGV